MRAAGKEMSQTSSDVTRTLPTNRSPEAERNAGGSLIAVKKIPPAPLHAFARDAKLTAALAVAVAELTVRLVKKWRKLRQPDPPKSA